MTQEEAIALRPDSRASYWIGLSVGGVFCLVVPAFAIALHRSLSDVLESCLFGLILSLLALQAAERLFWPLRAAERTASLSSVANSRIETLVSILHISGFVVWAVSFIGGRRGNSAALVGLSLIMLAHFLADLRGTRLYSVYNTLASRPPSGIDFRQRQAIHSEHWGER
jgi:hypothetical protein